MNLLTPRTTIIIGLLALAAGLFVTFYFPAYDRLGPLLMGFGVAAVAIALGKSLLRKRHA